MNTYYDGPRVRLCRTEISKCVLVRRIIYIVNAQRFRFISELPFSRRFEKKKKRPEKRVFL